LRIKQKCTAQRIHSVEDWYPPKKTIGGLWCLAYLDFVAKWSWEKTKKCWPFSFQNYVKGDSLRQTNSDYYCWLLKNEF
jgi:hypothetical protein